MCCVGLLPRHETKLIRLSGILSVSTTMFAFAGVLQLMLGLMFIILAATGDPPQAQQVFTSLALLSLLRKVGSAYLVRSFFYAYEMNVAVRRIQVSSATTCIDEIFESVIFYPEISLVR